MFGDLDYLIDDEAKCVLCGRTTNGNPGPHFVEEDCLKDNCVVLCKKFAFTMGEAQQVLCNQFKQLREESGQPEPVVCCECLDALVTDMNEESAMQLYNTQ